MSNKKYYDDMDKAFDIFENIASMDEYSADLDLTAKELGQMEERIRMLKKVLKSGQATIEGKVVDISKQKAAIEKALLELVEDYVHGYNALIKDGTLRGSRKSSSGVLGKDFKALLPGTRSVKVNAQKVVEAIQSEAAKATTETVTSIREIKEGLDTISKAKLEGAKAVSTTITKEISELEKASKKADEELSKADLLLAGASAKMNRALKNVNVRTRLLHPTNQASHVNNGGVDFGKGGLFFDFPTLKGKQGLNVYDTLHSAGGKMAKQIEDEFKKIYGTLAAEKQKAIRQSLLQGYARNGSSLVSALLSQGFFDKTFARDSGITPFSANGFTYNAATAGGLYSKDLAKLFSKNPTVVKKILSGSNIPEQFWREIAAHGSIDINTKKALLGMGKIPDIDKFIKANTGYKIPNTAMIGYTGFTPKTTSAAQARELAALGHLVPILVALDESNGGHRYGFRGANANDYRAMFGEAEEFFHSGSKASPLPSKFKYGPHSGDSGTIVHKFAEMLGNNEITIKDLENPEFLRKMKTDFENLGLHTSHKGNAVFTADGKLTKAALTAVGHIATNLTKGTSLHREISLGGLASVNGHEEALVATIDNLVEENGQYVVKDYKYRSKGSVNPFTELTQLAQEAALIRANMTELGLDPKKLVNKGQILHYRTDTGEEWVRNYDLGSTEDFLKFTELSRKLSNGEIELNEYVSKLPPVYKKAYADQEGPIGQYGGQGPVSLRYVDPVTGKKTSSNIFFGGEKGGASKGNHLFDLFKTNPAAVHNIFKTVFANKDQIPEEYLAMLGGSLYNASLAGNIEGLGLSAEEFAQKREFIEMARSFIPSGMKKENTVVGPFRQKWLENMINSSSTEDLAYALNHGTFNTTKYEEHVRNLIKSKKISESQGNDIIKNIIKGMTLSDAEDAALADYFKQNILYADEYAFRELGDLLPERFKRYDNPREMDDYDRWTYEINPEQGDFEGKRTRVNSGFRGILSGLLTSGYFKQLIDQYNATRTLYSQAQLAGDDEALMKHEAELNRIRDELFPVDAEDLKHMRAGNMADYTLEKFGSLTNKLNSNKELSENDKKQILAMWRTRLFGKDTHNLDFSIARSYGRAFFAEDILPSENLTPEQQQELAWSQLIRATAEGVSDSNPDILLEDQTKEVLRNILSQFGLGDFVGVGRGDLSQVQRNEIAQKLAKIGDQYGSPARSLLNRFMLASGEPNFLGDDFTSSLYTTFFGFNGLGAGSILNNFGRTDKFGNTGFSVVQGGAPLGSTWFNYDRAKNEGVWQVGDTVVGKPATTEIVAVAKEEEKVVDELSTEKGLLEDIVEKEKERVEVAKDLKDTVVADSTKKGGAPGGPGGPGGSGGGNPSGKDGGDGPKGLTPAQQKRLIYDTRMADYYYRTYTDLDYQQYTIQQAKAKEVSQAKIEMYDVQLKEIEYQKKLALDQYNEYKKGHAGVDYDTVEGKRQSILAQKKAAFFTSQKEQTNLFNQIDVKALQWFKRMMEGGLILKFLQLARQGIRRVVNEAKQLDQVMTNLRIVTNANRDEASSMMNTYNELAKQLGVTTKEVASSANEWLRQGYEAAEVNDLITASMYLSKLGMIDSTAATKDLTSAIKGFKLEASEAMSVVDKLTSIDLRAATSAGEIAEGLAQFANLGSLSGVDIDQASAYVATIADVSQRSGASVGQALKTIISRFGNVKAGAFNQLNLDEENTDTTEKLNDVEKVLNKLGISMRNTNLQFKDFDEVLDEIAERWETLDNVSKKAIANAFAGVRQQESFVTLMENYDKYRELLDASKNSAGTAESKYGAYKDSLQAATAGLTAAWEKIVNDAEINNILKDLTKLLTNLVELIPELLKHLPTIIATIENIKALSGNSILQKAGGYLGKQFGSALFGERGILGKTKYGINYRIKQVNADYDRRMREAKRNGELTAEREAEFIKARDEEIEVIKKSAAVKKQDTKATQEGAAAKKEEVSTTKEAIATEQQEAQANQQSAATEEQESTANQQSTMSEKQEVTANQLAVQSEMQETQANQRSGASEGVGSGGGAGKMSKAGAAMAGISIVANQAMAGLTALSTQGTTHKTGYKDANGNAEVVESSAEAQKAGSGWAALATFAIPIFGSWIGEKIAQAVTSDIDKERDRINHINSVAQKNLSGLQGLDAGIEAMADIGSNESIDAADKFLADIYSSDNAETRAVLEKYLGDKGSLYDVVNKIKEGNEEAYRDLKVAQLEAKKGQILNNYAGQLSKAQSKTGAAYNTYDNYAAQLNGWTIAGGGAAGLAGGAGIGALAGGAAVALGASGPVGWIIGAIGALVGLGFGIAAGVKQAEAERKAEEERHAREAKFNSMSYSQKIDEVSKTLEKAERQGNTEVVDKCNALLQALQEQKALVNQINNEINKITQEQALYSAKIGDEYITDMSVVALQQAGQDAIIEAYAKAIEENGGLLGYQLFDNQGNLTDSGYQYAMSQLKQQGNDAINSILSGGVYTLSEVLKLREKYGDERWIMDIMQNFATALNIPLDLLEDFEDRFGSLKLSEVLMSTAEIQTLMGNYTSLLSSITTGAGDTSKWMETIISQFPELIAYMGDTSSLFTHITTKINQLSQAYLQSQYDDIIGSAEFYKTIKDSFEGKLSQENVDALTKAGVDSVSSILSWIQQQYDSNGNLNESGTAVLDALKETVDEYGVEVTSNILKSYYDQIIDFRVKTLDKELENLNAQKEALQQINSQREYENKLIEAKLRLENASKEKKRVYRAGVGWVYEADQTAIAEAQKNLEELENQKTIAELDRQIAELTYEKEKLSSIYDEKNYETLSELYKAYIDQNELTNASSEKIYQSIKEGTDGISKALEELIQQNTEADAVNKKSALDKAKEAWEALQKETYGTSGYNTALQNYHSAYSNAIKNGATESDFEDWGSYNINGTSTSAWDTGSGDVNKQLADARMLFKLNDTGTPSQYFQGTASLGDPQYDSTILNYIFGDLKNHSGWMWAKGINGDKGFKPGAKGSDARFSIKNSDEDFLSYISRISQIDGVPDEMVFTGYDGTNESVYVKNGVPYKLVGTNNTVGMDIIKGNFGGTVWAREQMAHGSLDFRGGNALINELGSEAIVTPYGTVTTLPSHTGVIPADITKNLWELGEVAPMIQRQLLGQVNNDMSHKVVWGNDESFNIGVMNMTLNPDSSFDIDAFVDAMKTHVALNKNNRR